MNHNSVKSRPTRFQNKEVCLEKWNYHELVWASRTCASGELPGVEGTSHKQIVLWHRTNSISLSFFFFFFHFHTDCELFLVGEITTQEAAVNHILGGTQTLHLSYFECFRLSFVHKTGKKNYRNLSSMSVRPNYPASMSVSLPLTSHLFFVTIWGILCQKKKKRLTCSFVHLKWSGGRPAKGVVAKGNEAKMPRVTQNAAEVGGPLRFEGQIQWKPNSEKPNASLQTEITAWWKLPSRLSSKECGFLCVVFVEEAVKTYMGTAVHVQSMFRTDQPTFDIKHLKIQSIKAACTEAPGLPQSNQAPTGMFGGSSLLLRTRSASPETTPVGGGSWK